MKRYEIRRMVEEDGRIEYAETLHETDELDEASTFAVEHAPACVFVYGVPTWTECGWVKGGVK